MNYNDKFLNGLLKAEEIIKAQGVDYLRSFIESYCETTIPTIENARLDIDMQHRG
jgi:hypothetical protein